MKNSNIIVLTLSLIVAIVMAGCGTQATAEPTATQVPPTETAPVSSPQGAPTETSAPTPTDIPTETPTEVPTEPPTEAPAEAPAADASAVSFTNDVFPIIQSRCVNCHGGERIEEGLLMRSYAEILAGSNNGPVIVPGDTANSLLVQLVTTQEMPKRGPKLTPPQVQIITEWVAAGALNN